MAAAMVHKCDETVQQRILPITHYEGEEYQLRSFVLVTLFRSSSEQWYWCLCGLKQISTPSDSPQRRYCCSPSALLFKENSQEVNFHQSLIQLSKKQSLTTIFNHKAISLKALKQMKRISSKAKSKNIRALPQNRFGNYLLILNVTTKRLLPGKQ